MTVDPKHFVGLALAASVLATGCLQGGRQSEPTHRLNPSKVAESVERLELYARPNGLELSARDERAVAGFLQAYAAQGSGPLYINRPARALSGMGVAQTDALLDRLMRGSGLRTGSVQSGTYHTRPGDPAPVILSYRTLRAVPQDCARLGDLSVTHTNGVSPEFGCFASANLAAMIADPRQLIEPYATQAPNAQRRQVVYDRYIQGVSTASERPAGQQQSSQQTGG
ncbi:CpaD family pilus assembly lipoprotein [uncultured Algimonas sp.]|uniref:CpaD family pilus assembly lipoprotein n=1 Tax=uncultured Algimonas sp. TaxID=1547920 RepID=UPI00260DC7D8|nr:CpaD family pilus assembly lipoprotein [uncultured Algimonas sp.]